MRPLYTEAGEKTGGRKWDAYPRPQMVRENWQNLNGLWAFGTDPERLKEQILVPFCPESLLSRIGRTFPEGTLFCYRREFMVSLPLEGRRLLLYFGAVDQIAEVFVNGVKAGSHTGGYLPFSFDITELVRPDAENELFVKVRDDLNHDLPWGKQKRDRGGMWYTPVSGIWQTVWLESVPETYIRRLVIHTDECSASIRAEGVSDGVIEVARESENGGALLLTCALKNGEARIVPPYPHVWSPEDPYLYRFTLKAGEDEVSSYFALRRFSTKEVNGIPRLCLNGEPYFFNGLLDQGYFSDGIYTAPSPREYERDIRRMKALGFNTLRKHIKIEPEQFYYDCDRLGMVVFQDMVNCGDYSFLRDTALATAGLKISDKKSPVSAAARENFLAAMEETVRHLGSHPSIALWTAFNEGWGQFDADGVYERLKKLDPDRFVDAASGWFEQKESDVTSRHVYFKKVKPVESERPFLLSEFGGYVYQIPEHSAVPDKVYGYKICKTRETFVKDLRTLYLEQILPLIPQGLCGAVYTQVSDVEEETNGLLTYDRKKAKITPGEFADIAPLLTEAVKQQ
ncbi:MAG: glycoside hydrolase family 2 [Lachnospiraceae bacterium]|nr:glycoside hydrolase family 2 [Lachnospiraceae bacterium]